MVGETSLYIPFQKTPPTVNPTKSWNSVSHSDTPVSLGSAATTRDGIVPWYYPCPDTGSF